MLEQMAHTIVCILTSGYIHVCWLRWQVFAEVDLEALEEEANFYSLMFLVIGVVAAIAMFLQVYVYVTVAA